MNTIIIKIPRKKKKVTVIRSEEAIRRELDGILLPEEPIQVIEPEPEPEPEFDYNDLLEFEPEPEIEEIHPTVFTEIFTISNTDKPIEIPLNNIPGDMVSLDAALIQIQAAYDRGFEHGHDAAKASMESEVDTYRDMMLNIEQVIAELRQQYTKEVRKFRDSVVNVAVMTAEHIIGAAVSQENDIVINQIKKSILELDEDRVFNIILNPKDLDSYKQAKGDLHSEFPNLHDSVFTTDSKIAPGGCKLETTAGNIDATIETQLKIIKKTIEGIYSSRVEITNV